MIIKSAHLAHFDHPLSVDLDLLPGRKVLLLGNSGCGKTSLLKAIAGFADLRSGEIEPNGNKVAMLLQNPFHQIIMQKVHDELYFPLKNAGKSREEADIEIEKISEDLHIQHLLERDINTLSFGETQLVMIAATCLTEADLILMDEPTSHLDPPSVKIFYNCIKNMAKAGKSVLVTSQAPDEYIFVDMVYVMDQGVIKTHMTADKCPEALFEQGIQLDSMLTDLRLKEIAEK